MAENKIEHKDKQNWQIEEEEVNEANKRFWK